MVDRINPEMTTGDGCGRRLGYSGLQALVHCEIVLAEYHCEETKVLEICEICSVYLPGSQLLSGQGCDLALAFLVNLIISVEDKIKYKYIRSLHDAIEYGARKLRYQELKFEQTKDKSSMHIWPAEMCLLV